VLLNRSRVSPEQEQQSSRSPVNFLLDIMSREDAGRSCSASTTASELIPQENISKVKTEDFLLEHQALCGNTVHGEIPKV